MTKRNSFSLPLLGLAAVLSTGVMSAATFNECPAVGDEAGCAFLITVSSTGVVSISSVAADSSTPYDFTENGNSLKDDMMIGLLNNWTGHNILSVTLSGTNSFNFSADPGPSNDTPCSAGLSPHATGCTGSSDPTDYGGPGVSSIVQTTADSGTVSFGAGGVAPTSSACLVANQGSCAGAVWWGLEGPISGTPTVSHTAPAIPEPATTSLIGLGLLGVGLLSRFRRQN